MKDFLQNRTPREKNLIALSAALFTLFVIYWLIWQPIQMKYTQLQKDIVYNNELLAWMQQQQPLILQGRSSPVSDKEKDLFLIIDDNLKKSFIKESKPEMQRLSSDKVSVKFNQVSFDDLLVALGLMVSKFNIDIESIEVSKLKQEGLVQANITFIR